MSMPGEESQGHDRRWWVPIVVTLISAAGTVVAAVGSAWIMR
jgi:hypothetical protein